MRRRTALGVVSAAIGGAVVPLSFAPVPAAAQDRRRPQSPTARWEFDERAGTVTREAVSGSADPIDYVFNDARYKPDSDPVRRRGVRGRALYFDGYSTVVTAEGPGKLDPADGMTVDVWIAPYAYEHGIDGKPQALVNQHDPDAKTGFLLGLRRFGQLVFQLGFGTELLEVKGHRTSQPPRAGGHNMRPPALGGRQLRLYRDCRLIDTAATPDKAPQLASDEPLLIGGHNRPTLLNGEFHANMYVGLMDSVSGTLEDPGLPRGPEGWKRNERGRVRADLGQSPHAASLAVTHCRYLDCPWPFRVRDTLGLPPRRTLSRSPRRNRGTGGRDRAHFEHAADVSVQRQAAHMVTPWALLQPH
jgi:hypothetical protein